MKTKSWTKLFKLSRSTNTALTSTSITTSGSSTDLPYIPPPPALHTNIPSSSILATPPNKKQIARSIFGLGGGNSSVHSLLTSVLSLSNEQGTPKASTQPYVATSTASSTTLHSSFNAKNDSSTVSGSEELETTTLYYYPPPPPSPVAPETQSKKKDRPPKHQEKQNYLHHELTELDNHRDPKESDSFLTGTSMGDHQSNKSSGNTSYNSEMGTTRARSGSMPSSPPPAYWTSSKPRPHELTSLPQQYVQYLQLQQQQQHNQQKSSVSQTPTPTSANIPIQIAKGSGSESGWGLSYSSDVIKRLRGSIVSMTKTGSCPSAFLGPSPPTNSHIRDLKSISKKSCTDEPFMPSSSVLLCPNNTPTVSDELKSILMAQSATQPRAADEMTHEELVKAVDTLHDTVDDLSRKLAMVMSVTGNVHAQHQQRQQLSSVCLPVSTTLTTSAPFLAHIDDLQHQLYPQFQSSQLSVSPISTLEPLPIKDVEKDILPGPVASPTTKQSWSQTNSQRTYRRQASPPPPPRLQAFYKLPTLQLSSPSLPISPSTLQPPPSYSIPPPPVASISLATSVTPPQLTTQFLSPSLRRNLSTPKLISTSVQPSEVPDPHPHDHDAGTVDPIIISTACIDNPLNTTLTNKPATRNHTIGSLSTKVEVTALHEKKTLSTFSDSIHQTIQNYSTDIPGQGYKARKRQCTNKAFERDNTQQSSPIILCAPLIHKTQPPIIASGKVKVKTSSQSPSFHSRVRPDKKSRYGRVFPSTITIAGASAIECRNTTIRVRNHPIRPARSSEDLSSTLARMDDTLAILQHEWPELFANIHEEQELDHPSKAQKDRSNTLCLNDQVLAMEGQLRVELMQNNSNSIAR
ncbi:hypothetical protein BX616_002110 [Lobosporangium transversale]|uniref:Uncharacterized protein n=1 Tax=Lobosporangium transversale TaxID=64571 RepID=A0A1Y2H3B9_9FUNG|nr:hypothetical protein BCR41DRAFT_391464 [Lobosporangium transversale]KAF9901845.1 hypothetical protein BX616_002110 [Lobosporangium transversale]ORZ29047.1 hypothetical protein BCR41DRAFT_391464 [Lobosporangium transversale]|eukprot:XP_021886720.1 hypothetical protein BCR41DRAFT_391464 [Lobosporangium transversale]